MIKGLKICGVSDPITLSYILNHPYPPKYIGFITNYKESKRYVGFENLKNLINVNKKQTYFVSVLVRPTNELLEPYNTSREEGTGLGLSIVKKIVEDHGGKLVLSDAPRCASGETGAMIQVVLPLEPPETKSKSKMLEEI